MCWQQHNNNITMITNTSHKLNVQEKRKIETLIIDDIEQSERRYSEARNKGLSALSRTLIDNPPADVAKTFKQWQETQATLDLLERKVEKAGFSIQTWGNKPKLDTRHSDDCPPLRAYAKETSAGKMRFQKLKKDYMFALYGTQDIAELYKRLQTELTELVQAD